MGKSTEPDERVAAAVGGAVARQSETSRLQARYEKAFAESRRIYSLSPMLNPQFKELQRKAKAADGSEGMKKWDKKRVKIAW